MNLYSIVMKKKFIDKKSKMIILIYGENLLWPNFYLLKSRPNLDRFPKGQTSA